MNHRNRVMVVARLQLSRRTQTADLLGLGIGLVFGLELGFR